MIEKFGGQPPSQHERPDEEKQCEVFFSKVMGWAHLTEEEASEIMAEPALLRSIIDKIHSVGVRAVDQDARRGRSRHPLYWDRDLKEKFPAAYEAHEIFMKHIASGEPVDLQGESSSYSQAWKRLVKEISARSGFTHDHINAVMKEVDLIYPIVEKVKSVAARSTSSSSKKMRQLVKEAEAFRKEYPPERVYEIARTLREKNPKGRVTHRQIIEACGNARTLSVALQLRGGSRHGRKYWRAFQAAKNGEDFKK